MIPMVIGGVHGKREKLCARYFTWKYRARAHKMEGRSSEWTQNEDSRFDAIHREWRNNNKWNTLE